MNVCLEMACLSCLAGYDTVARPRECLGPDCVPWEEFGKEQDPEGERETMSQGSGCQNMFIDDGVHGTWYHLWHMPGLDPRKGVISSILFWLEHWTLPERVKLEALGPSCQEWSTPIGSISLALVFANTSYRRWELLCSAWDVVLGERNVAADHTWWLLSGWAAQGP